MFGDWKDFVLGLDTVVEIGHEEDAPKDKGLNG